MYQHSLRALACGLACAAMIGLAGFSASAQVKVTDNPEKPSLSQSKPGSRKKDSNSQGQQKKGQQKTKAANAKGREGENGENNSRQGGSASTSLAYPTGERSTSVLLIETKSPEQVRVGHEYNYEIKVTNITENLILENVEVFQQVPSNLEIESSQPSQQSYEGGATRWAIDRLEPGKSRTIQVKAVAASEGEAASCFRVSYNPTLCVVSQFIKPQLSLSKTAPNRRIFASH